MNKIIAAVIKLKDELDANQGIMPASWLPYADSS